MFRLSLRGMLILVALVAIAVVSLTYANGFWGSVVSGNAIAVLIGALIVAFVDRGFRQAFAMGMVLAIGAYSVAVLSGISSTTFGTGDLRNIELDPMEGRLPTTKVLRMIHSVVDRGGYFDQAGKLLPNYQPNTGSGFGGAGGVFGPSYREIPPREMFMPIGHCWWALLLGYAGGWFAAYVYRRRVRDESKLLADVS